jgi:hypothetical protein
LKGFLLSFFLSFSICTNLYSIGENSISPEAANSIAESNYFNDISLLLFRKSLNGWGEVGGRSVLD